MIDTIKHIFYKIYNLIASCGTKLCRVKNETTDITEKRQLGEVTDIKTTRIKFNITPESEYEPR